MGGVDLNGGQPPGAASLLSCAMVASSNLLVRCGAVLLIAVSCLSGGCATSDSADINVTPGTYARTFDVARDVLREERYTLDRVDAVAGIITTQKSSAVQEAWDIIQRRQRTIRVTAFDAKGGAIDSATQEASRVASVLKVTAILELIEAPTWRVPNSSVRLSTRSSNADLAARDLEPIYAVEVGLADALAKRLAMLIRERLASSQPAASSATR